MKFKKEIEKLKQKDNDAFESIYHQTRHAVYGIIIGIVQNSQLAEDILQDTYIEMVASIMFYNEKYRFMTWLMTIARNKSIDAYRKEQRLVSMDFSDEENQYLLPFQKSEQDSIVQAEFYLNALERDEREVVIMYAMEGMKHKEIALVLDKPLGTITWIYNKAMKKLRKL